MVLNRFQMAAVKRTAQNTKKLVSQREKVNAQMQKLAAELISINNQIDAWESPIKVMTGGWTSEQCIAYNGNLPEKETEEVVNHSVVEEEMPF
jgi:cell division protein FtsB